MSWKQRRGKLAGPRVHASVAGHEDVILVVPAGMTPAEYVAAIVAGALQPNDWLKATSQWHYGIKSIHVRAGAVNAVWLLEPKA